MLYPRACLSRITLFYTASHETPPPLPPLLMLLLPAYFSDATCRARRVCLYQPFSSSNSTAAWPLREEAGVEAAAVGVEAGVGLGEEAGVGLVVAAAGALGVVAEDVGAAAGAQVAAVAGVDVVVVEEVAAA